jgi:hypothetical protein
VLKQAGQPRSPHLARSAVSTQIGIDAYGVTRRDAQT